MTLLEIRTLVLSPSLVLVRFRKINDAKYLASLDSACSISVLGITEFCQVVVLGKQVKVVLKLIRKLLRGLSDSAKVMLLLRLAVRCLVRGRAPLVVL